MRNRFAVALTIIAATPLLAAQAPSNVAHSTRVLGAPPRLNVSPLVEFNPEAAPDRFAYLRLLQNRAHDKQAIASFGSSSPAIGSDPLIIYFNFNDPVNPLNSSGGERPGQITATDGMFVGPNGVPNNEVPGDTTGSPTNGALNVPVTPVSFNPTVFAFEFDSHGYDNMVMSVYTATTATGTTPVQAFSYSTDGSTFHSIGAIPNSSGGITSYALPADANNAQLIIYAVFTLPISGSYSTLIDNIQINGDDVSSVPEPSTWFGAAFGVLALGWMQRRRLLALISIAQRSH